MDDLIYTIDNERRFTSALGEWEDAAGCSADAAVGKVFDETVSCSENGVHKTAAEKALSGKNVDYEWFTGENENRVHYRTLMIPLRSKAGGVIGATGVIKNLTKIKAIEEKTTGYCKTTEACNSIFRLSFENAALDRILEETLDILLDLPAFSGLDAGCGIFTVEEGSGALVLSASRGLSDRLKESVSRINPDGTHFSRAFDSGKLLFIDNSSLAENRTTELQRHNHYCAPLIGSKKLLGFINFFLKLGYRKNDAAEEALGKVAGALSNVVLEKYTEARLDGESRKFQIMTDRMLFLISSIIEQKDPYIVGHQQRVAKLASNIAWELKLSDDQIHGLYITGLIHDIGKIAVPLEILIKPGRLFEYELNVIKLHVEKGYDLLKNMEFSWPVAQTVLQHHERLNGSGYPNRLGGKDILLEAKILAVADVAEAMSSDRAYHKAFSTEQVVAELERYKNVLYDADVVDACVNLFVKKRFTWDTVTL